MNDETKYARLPKWAQDEIWRLTRNIADLHAKLHAIAKPCERDAPGVSWLDSTSETRYRRVPGKSIRVCGDGIAIDATVEGDTITITYDGKHPLDCAIVPLCSNQIRIVRIPQ